MLFLTVLSPLCNQLYRVLVNYFANLNMDFKVFCLIVVGYIIAQFFMETVDNILNHNMMKITDRLNNYIYKMVNRKIFKISLENFDDPETLDLINRVINRIEMISLGSIGGFLQTIVCFIQLLSYLVVLFFVFWYFPIVILISLIPYVVLILNRGKKKYNLEVDLSLDNRKEEYLNFIATDRSMSKDIRVFNLIPYLIEKSKKIRISIYEKNKKIITKNIKEDLFSLFFKNLTLLICLIIICLSYINGENTKIGDIVFIITAIPNITSGLEGIISGIESFQDSFYTFVDWDKFMCLPEEDVNFSKFQLDDFEIQVKNLSYRYPLQENFAVKSINITIRENEKVAVVGANGSGKSTLINLLLGLYTPTSGEIFVGGNQMGDIIDEYRSKTVCIFQDYIKYQFSVIDNLKAGNMGENNFNLSYEYLDLASLVESLSDKQDTPLGQIYDGATELSGGQWQKIAIARALYRKDAKILIMDEPTASIDPCIENEIYENFAQMCNNKTVILISHRLSAAKLCDRIIVMDKGKIVEQGSHDELILRNGIYNKMFKAQSHLYQ